MDYKFTDEECQMCRDAIGAEDIWTVAMVARALGCGESTARRRLKAEVEAGRMTVRVDGVQKYYKWALIHDLPGPELVTYSPGGKPTDYFLDSQRQKRRGDKLTQENRALTDRLAALEEQWGTAVRDFALLGQDQRTLKPVTVQANELGAVSLFGDMHVGEYVDPDTVNGMNTYTPEIAVLRADDFAANTLHLIRRQRKTGNPIKVLKDVWIGDFIQGYIHDLFKITNTLTPPEEQRVMVDMLVKRLRFWLEHGDFDFIDIDCLSGNHGRLLEKMCEAKAGPTSWEWSTYHIVAMFFKDEIAAGKVRFNICNGYMLHSDFFGTPLCTHHGEAIRGGGDGKVASVRRAIKAWHEQMPSSKHPFHIFGHGHEMLTDMRSFIQNGSGVGYNGYAQKIKAAYEDPQMGLFYIHPDVKLPVCFERVWTDH